MISHTLLSMLHAQFQRYDVIYLGSVENGPLAGIPRLTGRPTVTYAGNTAAAAADSWDGFSQRYRRFSERMTAKLASCVVSDSRTVQQYYRGRFKAPAVFVPFGADVPHMAAGETLRRLGLRPDGYLLWVGQLTPGNNAHDVIEAYQQLGGPATGLSLCLAGEAPKGSDYAAELKRTAGPGVIFTGRLSSDSYYELGSNACLFVFSGESDRARPALLEALAFGACVIVNDAPANMEAVGDAALPYVGAGGAGDLARAVAQTLANPALIGEYRQRAARRATTIYSWNAVTDQYESLFAQLAHAMPRVPTGPFGASGA